MRPPTACDFCRSRRRRCQRGSSDSATCTLCLKHNVSCVASSTSSSTSYGGHARSKSNGKSNSVRPSYVSRPSENPSTSTSTTWTGISIEQQQLPQQDGLQRQMTLDSPGILGDGVSIELPPTAVCSHLVTIYFDYVHDQLHTLFQKPAFMADMSMNQIHPAIMYGVVALSARFSSHEYFAGQSPRTRGVAYARQAAALFDPSVVSLISIQTAVLLGACRIVEGDAQGESIYYGIGCRMAQLLDLPHRNCVSCLEREINIRVWYTLCMIDEWSSTGVGVPKQMTSAPTDIPLPCEEMAFLQLRANDFSASASPWDEGTSIMSSASSLSSSSSLLAQMIILNRILSDVNKLNKRSVEDRMIFPDDNAVHTLSQRLDAWESELPSFMRDDRSNLAHYAGQGLGRIFVAVYLGYYHFGQLLFYQYLHGASGEVEGFTSDFPRRCKYHAAKLCNMVYAALETPGCDVLYNMVGHVLVVASTVQIHTVLFSTDDDEIAAARQRLERNYTILLRLRDLWPSLDFCMMRLQAFHKACRSSMDTSFRLDKWMLTFLSEFAKPVDDDKPTEADWAIGDIAITPRSDFGFNPKYFEELMGP